MKKFLLGAMMTLAMAAPVFTACDDDDDWSQQPSGNNTAVSFEFFEPYTTWNAAPFAVKNYMEKHSNLELILESENSLTYGLKSPSVMYLFDKAGRLLNSVVSYAYNEKEMKRLMGCYEQKYNVQFKKKGDDYQAVIRKDGKRVLLLLTALP
ncbi:secreted protein, partial [gut metagenome]